MCNVGQALDKRDESMQGHAYEDDDSRRGSQRKINKLVDKK